MLIMFVNMCSTKCNILFTIGLVVEVYYCELQKKKEEKKKNLNWKGLDYICIFSLKI